MAILDTLYDIITSIGKFIIGIFDILIETFNAVLSILGDIPDYISSILLYLDILPGEAKVFCFMMLHILIIFTVVKIINLVVPFM